VAARRVATLLEKDTRAKAHLQRVAEEEANRLAGRKLSRVTVELAFRSEGSRIFVDLDVEATA
jgi:hypothetical protein